MTKKITMMEAKQAFTQYIVSLLVNSFKVINISVTLKSDISDNNANVPYNLFVLLCDISTTIRAFKSFLTENYKIQRQYCPKSLLKINFDQG